MFLKAFSVFLLAVTCHGRHFDNPVLDGGDYPDPGTIKVNGVYYTVTTTNNDKSEKYPIHTSTDLQHWEFTGRYIFNADNFPVWSKPTEAFWAPEIHRVGENYVCYFTAWDEMYSTMALGVAYSKDIEGPYKSLDRPIRSGPGVYAWDSSLMNVDGKLMLLFDEVKHIRLRNLTDDGLAFKDEDTVLLFQPELPWEGITVEGPWYVFRNNYHYVFYSAAGFCDPSYSLAVARSRNPTGPYEKFPEPLLVSNDRFKGPGHGSIVRDVDDQSWVFVHHGWKDGAVCGDNFRLLFCSSLEWGDDDWPKKMQIGD